MIKVKRNKREQIKKNLALFTHKKDAHTRKMPDAAHEFFEGTWSTLIAQIELL